jgi:translocation and assembly module TamB
VEFGAGGLADASLEVVTNDVALDAPLDLRSLSDAKLRFRRRDDEYVLDGQVTLDEAGLTGDINFDEGLLAAIGSRRTLDLTEERNPFLEQIRFDVNVDTATPILVDNNLARAEITADLRLLGTPYEPGLSGRLTVLEESEIVLNERRYEVERGVITFLGERRIMPSFDLRLNTTARNYDITVAVSGTPGDTDTSLTSEPTLPEPDIMALLVTGRTMSEMRGEEFEVAQQQVLSYLAGRVGSRLGRGIERATGFDTVRIEPNLIAHEADPSARLTIGEDIADNLELIYSVDLTNSSDQIWVAEYDVTRRFQTRAVRQNDNSYRFDIRHDLRFGGTPAPARVKRQRPVLADLTINSDGTLSEAELQGRLKI